MTTSEVKDLALRLLVADQANYVQPGLFGCGADAVERALEALATAQVYLDTIEKHLNNPRKETKR